MIVECISNRPDSVKSATQQAHLKENVHLDEVDLKRGRQYQVFGIAFRDGFPWFYVCEDADEIDSLRPHFSGFFKVVDPSVSSSWQYCEGGHSESSLAFLPADWARTPSLYEEFIDGSESARAVLAKIYRDMTKEKSGT